MQFGQLGVFFERNEGDLVLESPDGEDHPATVRLEAWDAPPPDPGAPWRPVEDTTIEGGTGFVTVGSVAEEASRRLIIGPPHFLYGVTAHVQQGEELPEFIFEEEFERAWEERAPERWLIRFWPLRDVFDPARHARPDRAHGRRPRAVEVPVSAAEHWPVARLGHRQAALHKQLARQGMTMADFLTAQGLPPDMPFDRWQAAMAEREAPALAEREGWPHWLTELVKKYPQIIGHWHRLPDTVEQWASEGREERVRDLAESLHTAEILSPDGGAFTADIHAYEPQPGGTYRGWRWDYANRPAHETFGVDRRVVCHDTMSGKVLVTGIVTVLGRDRQGGYEVRDATPAEAARLRCAEAAWSEPDEMAG
ncbi:hypothetical protein E1286_00215 [Nonomuraea terrae]|uniref:Uncharacterized protein n=1 Tax=Nonomuraea terrae TaxID=2530383 RepID=A0A4R4ZF63_9ACTN|nr:hypothetical protein [Nonomuraea terrae]TDD57188.1 hypothetical protein E1286_00215 [Nonomuraea terrae]